jgi:hypothetical protein
MDFKEVSAKEPSDVILITDAQTELKKIVEEYVREGKPQYELKEKCEKVISKLRDRLKNDDTREKVTEAMQSYVRELYARFVSLYGALRAMAEILRKQGVVKSVRRDGLPRGGIDLSMDPLSYNMETAARIDFQTYQRHVREELGRILSTEPRPDYGERNINMRLIAELNVRYEKQMDMIKDLSEQGEDLVWIDPHANCSARCEPWQGKLYSISGRMGKTDEGVSFQPLTNATDVRVTTKSGRTYMNGCVTGFGCRHKLTPYRPGNKPVMIPAEVVEKQRKAEEQQRALERRIRYEKERAIVLREIDPEQAKEARKKARDLTQVYNAFSQKSNLPRVETRTRVMQGERMYERNRPK